MVTVDEESPVDDGGVQDVPIGVVAEGVQRVPEGLPLRRLGVEQHDVGSLARLDDAEFVAQPRGRRAEPRGHLPARPRRGPPPRAVVLADRHVHGGPWPAPLVVVVTREKSGRSSRPATGRH